MEKINFQDGQLVKAGYVEIDGTKHFITEAEYDGATPLSSFILNKLQSNIETAIGEVSSFDPVIVTELPSNDIQEKTMYLVLSNDEGTIEKYDAYIYKDNEWKQIGSAEIDPSKLTVNLVENSYKLTLTEAVASGGTITVPASYKVGLDRLDVYLNGEKLIKATSSDEEGHYYEVGTEGNLSNTIRLSNDWSAKVGDVFEFTIMTNGQGLEVESDTVIVSAIEPTGENRQKVWLQKGIELYDSSKNISGKYIDINGQEINNDGWTITDYMPISNNIYTGLTDVGNAPHSAFYNENKEFVSSFKQSAGNNYLNKVENAKYVRFSIPNVDIDNFRFKSLNTQYILNDNNVYEEFMKKHEEIYSTEEQVIGKWVDGKTLYRKTLIFPNGTNIITQKQYLLQDYGITDVDEIFISHPSFYTDGTNRIPFPLNDGNKFELQVNKTILSVAITYEKIAKSYMVVTLEYTKK